MIDFLQAKIEEKARRADERNIPEALGFLDPAEQAQARLGRNLKRAFFSGGYDGAERAFLFFMPDYYDEDTFPIDDYIKALSACTPHAKPSHRDFLGSLMGLGIARECIGDILVGEESIILLDAKIAPFVMENLTKIGRGGVSLKEIPLCDIVPSEEPYDTVEATVASLRLDAVAACAFHVSRTLICDAISKGELALNWLPCENPSAEVREGDMISWRGHGRAKLFSCGGTSKKGRQFVCLHVYVKKK